MSQMILNSLLNVSFIFEFQRIKNVMYGRKSTSNHTLYQVSFRKFLQEKSSLVIGGRIYAHFICNIVVDIHKQITISNYLGNLSQISISYNAY